MYIAIQTLDCAIGAREGNNCTTSSSIKTWPALRGCVLSVLIPLLLIPVLGKPNPMNINKNYDRCLAKCINVIHVLL